MEHEMRGTGFRVGTVSAIDTAKCKVRVKFPDRDQLVSYWLPVLVRKSQNDKFYDMPDVGEQVCCLMDLRDEAGVVLGAVYSSTDTPPVNSADKLHVTFKDTAVLEYDRNTHVAQHLAQDTALAKYDAVAHALTIALPASAVISIAIDGGGSLSYDGDGNWKLEPGAGKILLADAAGGTQPVARIGDSVVVEDPDDGPIFGHITSGSSKVSAGG